MCYKIGKTTLLNVATVESIYIIYLLDVTIESQAPAQLGIESLQNIVL